MSRMHLPPVDKTRSYADQLVWPCGSADAGVGPVGGAPKGKLTPGGATCGGATCGGAPSGGAPSGGTTPKGGGRAASSNKLDTSPPLLGMEASPFPDG